MSMLLKKKQTTDSIPTETPVIFFTELKKDDPSIHMEPQKTQNGRSNPEQILIILTLEESQYLNVRYTTKP